MSTIRHLTLRDDRGSEHDIAYTLIRSKRRTYTISVSPEGEVTLRAPQSVTLREADDLIRDKQHWVLSKIDLQLERHTAHPQSPYTPVERAALEQKYRSAARILFAERVRFFEPLLPPEHLRITGIRIAAQKSRWGSCSSRGTLSFNWKLMLAPPEVLDYVVVHELCHLVEMNHSKAFWDLVGSILPDYKRLRKWLKDNGASLLDW